MPLIFAYGSNLCRLQMRERCPSAEVVSPAVLPRVRLAFAGASARWGGGVAGIELARKSRLYGVVYRMSELDVVRLDAFEGHPTVYERAACHPTLIDGTRRETVHVLAHVYMLVRGISRPRPPSFSYLATIRRGYEDFGLPVRSLTNAYGRAEAGTLTPMTVPAYEEEEPCRSRNSVR